MAKQIIRLNLIGIAAVFLGTTHMELNWDIVLRSEQVKRHFCRVAQKDVVTLLRLWPIGHPCFYTWVNR